MRPADRLRVERAPARRHMLIGAALMGIGATLAAGCNIGQGLSGVSTLSAESLLAVLGIVTGIAFTVKWLETRESRSPRVSQRS